MAIAPRGVVVKAPRCLDNSKYGLFSVVEPSLNVDPHWMASGIEWEEFLCSPGVTGFIDQCPPLVAFTKPSQRSNQFCHADPFVVVGSYKCPPVGRPSDQAFEIARQRLLKWEERQVEQTLWTGAIANGSGFVNPSFAFGNSECGIVPIDLNPAGALAPASAIALLETALGNTVGCGGIIHAPIGFSIYLANLFLLERKIQGDGYVLPTGTDIIFGQGYPGSGPANVPAAAGETWLFATGPLVMTRSDLFQTPDNIEEGFNRMINDVEIRAERFYSIGFSCALFAVRTTLSCDCC